MSFDRDKIDRIIAKYPNPPEFGSYGLIGVDVLTNTDDSRYELVHVMYIAGEGCNNSILETLSDEEAEFLYEDDRFDWFN